MRSKARAPRATRPPPFANCRRETGLSVPFTPEELQAYRAQVLRDHPVLTDRKIVLMYPGGGILPERAWPAEHYARVARGLCNEAGYGVGFIGLKDDSALAADLKQRVGSDLCIALTGYTRSLRELLMLFHASHLLLTNDGGPGHFASLTPDPHADVLRPRDRQALRPACQA